TSKVKTKLLTLDNFDGTRVKVVTDKGVVYLMGLLTRAEADRATEVTRQTGGVQKVVKLFQYTD
ncbi:MAG: phospholipid-binding domain lipoprotein, partial [Gammaproteobacteria bacterium]|nr:phospholipid-binding domain lipoprotein [Gammaproteobacteria bacterium]